MQTGKDTTVWDGEQLALWKVNTWGGSEPHAMRVCQSDGKAHVKLQGRQGVQGLLWVSAAFPSDLGLRRTPQPEASN